MTPSEYYVLFYEYRCLQVYMCTVYMPDVQSPEKGVGCPRRFIDGCELPCRC